MPAINSNLYRTLLLVFSIGWIFHNGWGQSQNSGSDPIKPIAQFHKKNWTTENGLPSNAVQSVIHTRDGYLWFATYNGLARFDGIKFQIYSKKTVPSFTANGFIELFEDHSGVLWIGTNGNGLLKFKDNTFTLISDNSPLETAIVTSISEDHQGNILIGTRNGVFQYGKEGLETLIPNANVYDLTADDNNNLWIATLNQGLIHYSNGAISRYSQQNSLLSDEVRSVFIDNQNNLWVGTINGISIIQGETVVSYRSKDFSYPILNVNVITGDSKGSIWFGTDRSLIRYVEQEFEVITEKVGFSEITDLAEDFEGNLWLATNRDGIIRLKNTHYYNYGVKDGLPNSIVNVIYQDQKQFWIGTEDGLARIHNGNIETFQLGEKGKENRIRSILKDSKGHLWLATYGGLIQFKNGIKKIYKKSHGLVGNGLRVLYEDNLGTLWIGSKEGLNAMVNDRFKTFDTSHGLNNEWIMSIFQDSQSNLWVGTNGGGIHLFDGSGFKGYTTEDGLAGNVVFKIIEDSDQLLWICTNGGISVFDGSFFRPVQDKEGLFNNSIFQLVIDNENNYWFTTNNGVFYLKGDNIKTLLDKPQSITEFKLFNSSDGMISSEITGSSYAMLADDGKIWLPTLKGVSVFDPQNLRFNQTPPPVVIEKVLVDQNLHKTTDEIILSPGQKRLDIFFTGLSFFAPAKVKFKYQLENFDENWSDAVSNRSVSYTNLPPGEFTFKVAAQNNDGVWSEQDAVLSIVHQAFFYQTNFFYVILALGLIGLGAALFFLRARNLKITNLELELEVNRRTDDLKQLNAIKDKMFSIVSHDLRGPINTLEGVLELLGQGNLSSEELSMLSRNLGRDVGHLKIFLDNLLNWARSQMHGITVNQQSVDLKKVVDQTYELFQSEADRENINLKNRVSDNTLAWVDLDMVCLIIRNLVANAMKFTGEEGVITVEAQTIEETIELSVIDNGKGMSQEMLDSLFKADKDLENLKNIDITGSGLGLILCKEFIKKNEGEIWAESKEGVGSKFSIKLKKATGLL